MNAAKSIIHEIWSHYTKQFPKNEKEIIEHLDWNFCYPFRTASLTLCVSCVILLRYTQAIKFLEDSDLFEYVLAIEILQDLIQLLPIEQKLTDLIKASSEPKGTTIGSNSDSFVEFWGCMLDWNSSYSFYRTVLLRDAVRSSFYDIFGFCNKFCRILSSYV